jgi:predicted amidohydrolase
MSAFKIALAQYPIGRWDDFGAWRLRIERHVAESISNAAQLIVFPEYSFMELASLEPRTMGELQESLKFVARLLAEIDAVHADLAVRHGVHIVAGSLPCPLADGRIVNRARLFAPSGRVGIQDKIVMTRFEREQWHIAGGDTVRIFETTLGRIAISICYDIEFPLIARAQAQAGAMLIVAPSCTDTMQGYWRVRIGAQARALENQCYVAQAPTVGMAPWSPVLDENYGAAGLFGPPVLDVPADGVLALGELNAAQWVLGEIDPERVARWRADGAVRPFAHWPEQVPGGALPPLACEIVDLR